jgi:hypothetical protein
VSLSAILSEVGTLAATISGVGVIRTYELYVSTLDALKANFMSGGVINALEIDRVKTIDNRFSNYRTRRDHTLQLNFYYGLNSGGTSTRPTFRGIVESAESVFRNDYRLSGNAVLAGPFQIEQDGYIDKAGVLLHYCQCSLVAREDVS